MQDGIYRYNHLFVTVFGGKAVEITKFPSINQAKLNNRSAKHQRIYKMPPTAAGCSTVEMPFITRS